MTSSSQRGFSLDLSFSPYDFVLGVGVVGESSYCFNYDTYFNPIFPRQATLPIGIGDATIAGRPSQIGGVDLTYILRIPVLGPFVRATVLNEDARAPDTFDDSIELDSSKTSADVFCRADS